MASGTPLRDSARIRTWARSLTAIAPAAVSGSACPEPGRVAAMTVAATATQLPDPGPAHPFPEDDHGQHRRDPAVRRADGADQPRRTANFERAVEGQVAGQAKQAGAGQDQERRAAQRAQRRPDQLGEQEQDDDAQALPAQEGQISTGPPRRLSRRHRRHAPPEGCDQPVEHPPPPPPRAMTPGRRHRPAAPLAWATVAGTARPWADPAVSADGLDRYPRPFPEDPGARSVTGAAQ